MSVFEVHERIPRYEGQIFTLVTDKVEMPGGKVVTRDYVRHPGAVGVVPYDDRRVLLVRQYRPALGRELWELPAGLVDVAGEEAPVTAQRELGEEADLRAGRLDLLVDLHLSPGMSNERIRLFLARDLSPVPDADRHERHDEEAVLTASWFDLDEAIAMIFRGEITNASAVGGLLATAQARDAGWSTLRPADTPPPA
jgi:8-oxo-dGTP pyrophosphatase MutT (NUDIX family)